MNQKKLFDSIYSLITNFSEKVKLYLQDIVQLIKEYIKNIRLACFPFLQGGQLVNMLAGVGAALEEADCSQFKEYTHNILRNMDAMLKGIKSIDIENKLRFVSEKSENHLIIH